MAERARGKDENRPRTGDSTTTPGGAAGGAASGAAGERTTANGPAAASRPRGGATGAAAPAAAARSRLGWVALTVTALLLVWQVVYALTVAGPGLDGREVYTSAWLLVSLVLAVGSAVLGIVAASQRVSPRWPATTALAVGTYVFLVCIATWAGSIITTA